ncbi:hypothetical protein B0H17DRAFT_1142740 [Mycena rosella]|uniref:Uncharacterized protein n=1 Tax=Mycena rosella TaxID=1033263 RepID=A0AAD7CWX3_MYCRO|nr:hypothetical protein B0H17DRAFT_1142740 [Mycena rosella]
MGSADGGGKGVSAHVARKCGNGGGPAPNPRQLEETDQQAVVRRPRCHRGGNISWTNQSFQAAATTSLVLPFARRSTIRVPFHSRSRQRINQTERPTDPCLLTPMRCCARKTMALGPGKIVAALNPLPAMYNVSPGDVLHLAGVRVGVVFISERTGRKRLISGFFS